MRASAVLIFAGLVGSASAGPVLHEYIELGAGTDLVEPRVTGDLPGLPSSPRAPGAVAAEAGVDAADSPSASPFSMDADTRRPDRVDYEDPFTPTIVPFKRSIAYDAVNGDGDLVVRDGRVSAIGTRRQPGAYDEHFQASLVIDLEANEASPIPSVAPGAKLVVAHTEPRVDVRIGADSAENWFVHSSQSGRVRLTLQLTADRRVFGSEYRDSSWSEVGRELPPLPENVKSSALDVARTLGVSDARSPRLAVANMVDHFRRFSPSARRPTSRGLSLYRDLALTARGICRHRAYAFMITALGIGIPTRYVMNEAHAWVEVFDGEIWHRIDLGGAAEQLSMDENGRPRHVEPRDPFAWQNPNESGTALASRRSEPRANGANPAPGSAPDTAPSSDVPGGGGAAADSRMDPAAAQLPAPAEPAPAQAVPDPMPAPPAPDDEALPELDVRLHGSATKAERGKTLQVAGQVQSKGRACQGSNVDVRLMTSAGPVALGTLVTNARGDFSGRLVIPWDAPLGDHQLEAVALGACGAP